MKYSKTLGSVVLSALLLLGTTGCSDNDTTVVETPVAEAPAPEAPVEELSSDLAAIAELEAAEAAAIAASVVGVT